MDLSCQYFGPYKRINLGNYSGLVKTLRFFFENVFRGIHFSPDFGNVKFCGERSNSGPIIQFSHLLKCRENDAHNFPTLR